MRPVKPDEIGVSLVGEKLAHFQLEEFIGGGGMGAVFRAVDNTLGRTVAVKVVSNESTDEETLRRFRNEAQSAARLDHPNIARVYYVGEDQGWNYIVFEYIEGVNIRDLVDHKGPLLLEEAISYTLQVAEALDHAAERDVVHRDIKPSNVLVMPDGRVKLVDMGLARLHHVDSPSDDLTATGVTLGTFDYISPEQARDPRSADVRSDLYSLGCTLYYMLTGMPPFPEGTVLQKLLSHNSDPPPDPREARPEIPDEIAAIATKLMAKQPGARHASPRALVNDLLKVADELGMAGIASRTAPLRRTPSWLATIDAYVPWALPLAALIVVATILHWVWRAPSVDAQQLPRPVLAAAPQPVAADLEQAPDADVTAGVEADAPRANEDVSAAGGEASPVEPAADTTGDRDSGRKSVSRPSGRGAGEPMPEQNPDAGAAPPQGSPAAERPTMADEGMGAESGTAAAPPPEEGAGPPAPESRPVRLVVGRPEDFSDPVVVVVSSLELAFKQARELPQVSVIELAFNDREVAPLAATLSRPMTVRPAPGYRPQLTFRPTSSALVTEKPMIRLTGGKLSWEDTHFVIQMPYEPIDGCSLFALNQVDTIALRDCWMTMRSEFDGTAAFFTVRGPRQMMADSDEGLPIVKSPSIQLLRCVARGKATLVQATEGLPFWLSWEDGLFSSTQRLIESSGLTRTGGAEMISVDLYRVTVSSDLGLCRLVLDDAAPAIPTLDLTCNHCVVRVDQNAPLIEHVDVPSVAKAESRLDRRGQQNFYAASTDAVWRIHSLTDGVQIYHWDDRAELPEARWFAETSSERVIRWAADPDLRSSREYEHTPDDFQLDESQRKKAGFDQLPAAWAADEVATKNGATP